MFFNIIFILFSCFVCLFSILCILCFCIVSPLVYSCLFLIFVQVLPLPPGGNPNALNKYCIISYSVSPLKMEAASSSETLVNLPRPHDVMHQKMAMFLVTTTRILNIIKVTNPTFCSSCHYSEYNLQPGQCSAHSNCTLSHNNDNAIILKIFESIFKHFPCNHLKENGTHHL